MPLLELLAPLIEADLELLAGATGLTTVASGGAYLIKSGVRRAERHVMRLRIFRALNIVSTPALKGQLIGWGNTGCVFTCTANDPLLKDVEYVWKSEVPLPERFALKYASFRNPGSRAEFLGSLGAALESAALAGCAPALCPFLAVGTIKSRRDPEESFAVELMPLIEGQSLRRHLRTSESAPGTVVPQLIRLVETVEFLEEFGFFTRSVDLDNVMVTPSGEWVRIDFDRGFATNRFPAARMKRIAKLTLDVIKSDALALSAAQQSGLFAKLRATISRNKQSREQRVSTPTALKLELQALAG